MASSPSPSPSSEPDRGQVLRPVVRTARGLTRLRPTTPGPRAAVGAARIAVDLGVPLSRRRACVEDPVVASLPWGVWPRPPRDGADAQVAAGLDPALARYAAQLRRRREARREVRPRVLPLVARRRGGTAAGPLQGPGGLARRTVPVDQPVAPLQVRLDRDAPDPLAARLGAAATSTPAASPAPTRSAQPTRSPRPRSGAARPSRRG